MLEHGPQLGLEDDTPETGIQVDFKKFHRQAVNAVDVWILVQFTEVPDKKEANARRDELIDILKEWFKSHGLRPLWALDVFFGPGYGYLSRTPHGGPPYRW